MARSINRLSARTVATARERGLYADGGGLYLQVSKFDTKSWLFKFMLDRRAREMGLGSIHTVSLADARSEAERCRKQVRDGIDPIRARQEERRQAIERQASQIPFKTVSTDYIGALKPTWKNPKHIQQWENTLETYAYPIIGDLPVDRIGSAEVAKVLGPIWHTKPETASRLRGRIARILDNAKTLRLRDGDNPAELRAVKSMLGAQKAKNLRVKHHPALPFSEIGAFMPTLAALDGVAPRALEFTIFTVARTREVAGAKWKEISFIERMWIVPPERMKSGREHRVPLNDGAMAALEEMRKLGHDGNPEAYIFPGWKKGKCLSENGLLDVLDRMSRKDITVHGFRSTFKDWAAERTNFDNIVSEAALAHVIGDESEAAYRRGDLFDKRKKMMEAWARFCKTVAKTDNVVAIAKAVGE